MDNIQQSAEQLNKEELWMSLDDYTIADLHEILSRKGYLLP